MARKRSPPRGETDRSKTIRQLAAAGVSARNVRKVLPEGTPGYSSSNFNRGLIAESERCLQLVNGRRFDEDGDPVVAASVDATAIGSRGKKEMVTIVAGVTASGRRLALGAAVTPGERGDDIYKLLRGIVDRGVDPGILWTTDQGAGIRAALERLTHPQPPVLQLCTTHAAGNVVKSLPEETRERMRLRIYAAWAQRDADTALGGLSSIAAELEEMGHDAAASSLRGSMDRTVTVNRLGLEGDIRRQLRSTNPLESINSSVKVFGSLGNVSRWKDDTMRLRWVALQLVELEQNSWHRLAEPQALVGLTERLMPGRHDLDAVLMRLPPSISIERLPVTLGDDERMRALATEWCAKHPQAVWNGSSEALKALGLTPGGDADPQALVGAMRCRNAEDGVALRSASRISIQGADPEGNPVRKKVEGILNLRWELEASPAAMREWRKGGEAAKRVEAQFTEAASAAVARATLTTEPHHGFAGAMALRRPTPEDPEQPLRASGIVFAVQRGREAKLGSPATDEMLKSATARAAEDAAKAVLDGTAREAPELAASAEPGAQPRERGELASVRPGLLAGVETRALEIAPRMVTAGFEELRRRAGRLAEAWQGLGAIEAEVREWRQGNWRAAACQIAATRGQPRPSSTARQNLWRPLSPGQRLVLGEEHSLWLLGDAATLAGIAGVDAETRRELGRAAGEDPLAELRQPVARAAAAAEAIAAGRELERRRLFEAAREGTGRETPPAPPLRDGRGELVASPVDRYRRALGSERAAALDRYARGVAPELSEMDDAAVRRLAAATEGAWAELDPAAGMRLAGLERDRDATFGERLRALHEVGRGTALSQRAERGRDASSFFAAHDRAEVAKGTAKAAWERLRALEAATIEQKQTAGSPELLVRNHPEAALHHAAHAELCRREKARELPLPETAPERYRGDTAIER